MLCHVRKCRIMLACCLLIAGSNNASAWEKTELKDLPQKAETQRKKYEESANEITLRARQSLELYKEAAQLLAGQVEDAMKERRFQGNASGKLADERRVNVGKLLSRYYSKYHKEAREEVPELMIFASFTMPEASLKALGEQARLAGGVMIFRGMYNNSLTATANEILKLNERGIPAMIHPRLFKMLNVKVVPTIVMVDKYAVCLQPEATCTPVFDKLTGNVSLWHALEQFVASGDYKDRAQELLRRGKP